MSHDDMRRVKGKAKGERTVEELVGQEDRRVHAQSWHPNGPYQ